AALLGEVANLPFVAGANLRGQILPQIFRRVIKRKLKARNLAVELLEGQKAVIEVDDGVFGLWRRSVREATEPLHLVLVIALYLAAGPGDAQGIEQPEKVAAEGRNQIAGCAFRDRLLRPDCELGLRLAAGIG